MIESGSMVRVRENANNEAAGKTLPVIMGGSARVVCAIGGLRFTVPVEDIEEVFPRFTFEAYSEFVTSRLKQMPSLQEEILHCAVGCSTEAGELLSTAKKLWAYDKPLGNAELENLIEESGDLLFYLCGLIITLEMTLDEVAERNRLKLLRRYPRGYSNEAAIARADKGGTDASN